jgi:hypothetical protein
MSARLLCAGVARHGALDRDSQTGLKFGSVTGEDYDFLSRQNSLSAAWTPSKRVTILGEYTRSTLRANIGYGKRAEAGRCRCVIR